MDCVCLFRLLTENSWKWENNSRLGKSWQSEEKSAVTCEYIGQQLKKVTKITSINGVVEIVHLEYKSTLAGQVTKKNFQCCS